ncbi:MAG: copper amine oxidase N-terminal domain-containing protein [Eubacteriales bacterium]
MKRCAAIINLVVIMIMLLSGYASNPAVSFVKVNGNKVNYPDGQPIIEAGRTSVPVRFIAEALGYEVGWIQETKTVTNNNGQILLPIGSNTATVNGKQVAICLSS